MIVICVGIVILSGIVGILISKRLSQKVQFFDTICDFCDYLVSVLSFEQSKLPKIVADFCHDKNDSATVFLKSFFASKNNFDLSNGPNFVDINFPDYLNLTEKSDLMNFLNGLGKSDCQTQIQAIKNYKQKFSKSLSRAKENSVKNGGLATKLSLGVGLILAIVIY